MFLFLIFESLNVSLYKKKITYIIYHHLLKLPFNFSRECVWSYTLYLNIGCINQTNTINLYVYTVQLYTYVHALLSLCENFN